MLHTTNRQGHELFTPSNLNIMTFFREQIKWVAPNAFIKLAIP